MAPSIPLARLRFVHCPSVGSPPPLFFRFPPLLPSIPPLPGLLICALAYVWLLDCPGGANREVKATFPATAGGAADVRFPGPSPGKGAEVVAMAVFGAGKVGSPSLPAPLRQPSRQK